MYCPKCNNKRTRINGSHADKKLFIETRRRECVKCHYRFNTQEKILGLAEFTNSHDVTHIQLSGLHARPEGGF